MSISVVGARALRATAVSLALWATLLAIAMPANVSAQQAPALQAPAQQAPAQQAPAPTDEASQPAADPPSRVGRVAYIEGTVSYHTADQTQWDEAAVNEPVTTGDACYTDQNGRATLQIGRAYVRLDNQTEVDVDTLDDQNAVLYVPQGSVSITLKAMNQGEVYEVLTPSGTVQLNTPGRYRVDVTSDGTPPKLTVLEGSADVFGDSTRVTVTSGQTTPVVVDQAPQPVQPAAAAPVDGWAEQQDAAMVQVPDYVNPDVPGIDATATSGQWAEDPNYGRVWYPPDPNWVPFQNGSWEYRDGFQWTWVDDAPWGFCTSHYGRTVQIGDRWAWVPGPGLVIEPQPQPVAAADPPILVQPVFTPAVVSFVDVPPPVVGVGVGVGPVVGWVPLAPGEVYVPPFAASPAYVNQVNIFGGCGCHGGGGVNITNITNTNITNITNVNITNRRITDVTRFHNHGSTTVVSQSSLVGSRHIGGDTRLHVPPERLSGTHVNVRPGFKPTPGTRGGPTVPSRGPGDVLPRRPAAPGPAIRPTSPSRPGTRPGTRPTGPAHPVPGSTHPRNQTSAAGPGPRPVPTPRTPGTRPGGPGTRPGAPPTTPTSAAPGTRPGTRPQPAGPGTRPGTPVTPTPGLTPSTAPGSRQPGGPGTRPTTPSRPGAPAPGTPGTRPGAAPTRPGPTPPTPVTPATRPTPPRPAPSTPGTRPGAAPTRPGATPVTPATRPTPPRPTPGTPGSRPGATPTRPGTTPAPGPGGRTNPPASPATRPTPSAPRPGSAPGSRPGAAPTRPGTTPGSAPAPGARPNTPSPNTPRPAAPGARPQAARPNAAPQPGATPPRPQSNPASRPTPQQRQPPRTPQGAPPQPRPQPQVRAPAPARPQPQSQPRPQPQAQPHPQAQPQQQPACNPPHRLQNGRCV